MRVVRAAHERAGLDVDEPHGERLALEVGELVGMVEAHHRRVLRGGPQILSDRQDAAAGVAQVAERRE